MIAPVKPFQDYKWRWAVLMPTEGLNDPPVFLGVLRALRLNEGKAPNSKEFIDSIRAIKKETKTPVDLVRTDERNLIRNSGQYWKALNLMRDSHGEILLTDFGRKVSDGLITTSEFASTIVKTFELPHTNFADEVKEWGEADLKIKPLELIVQILVGLFDKYGEEESYVTPNELIRIIIPLAGNKASVEKHIEAISKYRRGSLNIRDWPDCAPRSNDKRMAREFLLFLLNYGFCELKPGVNRFDDKFYLLKIEPLEIRSFAVLDVAEDKPERVARKIRETRFPSEFERQRVMTEILTRPNQAIFRNNVLVAFNSKCLITGVKLEVVLEAAHIMPVSKKGKDTVDNGLCLRSDIHLLYDTGHLRIDTCGGIHLSEDASQGENYEKLPKSIEIPKFINRDFVEWRWKYR